MRSYPQPTLRRKKTGLYFVRFGGKDHSLGTDEAAARERFFAKLAEWQAWRNAREAEVRGEVVDRSPTDTPAEIRPAAGRGARPSGTRPGRPSLILADLERQSGRSGLGAGTGLPTGRRPGPEIAGVPTLTVAELTRRMFDSYTAEGRLGTARWFQKHLVGWLGVHGGAGVLELTIADPMRGRFLPPVVPLLAAWVGEERARAKRRPRTINHDITAVKRLFNYGAQQGLCPAVNWQGVRRVPVSQSKPEDLSPEVIAARIVRAEKVDRRLGPWLRLNYLALLRPSETVALVCAVHAGAEKIGRRNAKHTIRRRNDVHEHRGFFLPVHDAEGNVLSPRGLFELEQHKTMHKGQRRVIVLSDAALEALDAAEPIWSTHNAYSQACRRALVPGLPHITRDSAATWLRSIGTARADVDALLGHAVGKVSAAYIAESWRHLREIAGRLEL